jgi:F-type H+-transporting ATPase subunit delta
MFSAERWAEAFIRVRGDPSESLALLRALLPCIQRIPGHVSGNTAALHLERALRRALQGSGETLGDDVYACRLLVLLVKHGYFAHIGDVIDEIEHAWERQNGVLAALVESAFPLDRQAEPEFLESLKDALRRKTGAKEIKLINKVNPELLGGYRLRIGSELLDLSVQGQLRQMARYLG